MAEDQPLDPSEMPWSPERLTGLADLLAAELADAGVDVDDPQARGAMLALMRWLRPRLTKLNVLDVMDGISNTFGVTPEDG
jgi:hypothetical protein